MLNCGIGVNCTLVLLRAGFSVLCLPRSAGLNSGSATLMSVFAMSWHDYEKDLSDTQTTVDFGKYTGKTPEWILQNDPGWLVWCWNNTHRWCGSEAVVSLAFTDTGNIFHPRQQQLVQQKESRIEDFEQAILDTYGQFPKPIWMK